MNVSDKQRLIKLAQSMPCAHCGNREHEYIVTDKLESMGNRSITIPNVPSFRCKQCNTLSYPSFAAKYIEEQRNINIE